MEEEEHVQSIVGLCVNGSSGLEEWRGGELYSSQFRKGLMCQAQEFEI